MSLSFKSPSKLKKEINERLDSMAATAIDSYEYTLDEAGRKIKIKVNAKGQRRRKVVCGKGKKFDGTKCVVQKASEKLAKKKGMRQKKRTMKSQGAGKRKKSARLRLKAMKKRRGQGLK